MHHEIMGLSEDPVSLSKLGDLLHAFPEELRILTDLLDLLFRDFCRTLYFKCNTIRITTCSTLIVINNKSK